MNVPAEVLASNAPDPVYLDVLIVLGPTALLLTAIAACAAIVALHRAS